jgi:S1-C subfamily serine protease
MEDIDGVMVRNNPAWSSRVLASLAAVFLLAGCIPVNPPSTPVATPSPDPELERLRAEATSMASRLVSLTPAVTVAPPMNAAEPTVSVEPTAFPNPTVMPTVDTLDAIDRVKYATVFVLAGTPRGASAGSGVSLGGGRVLTNNHVVRGSTGVALRFASGRAEQVQVMKTDSRRDLALLRSAFSDEPALAQGDSRSLRSGENLYAVGYPVSFDLGVRDSSVTRGIFSSRWQGPDGVWHIQTDTPMNPGNSGGPLVDGVGRLVGVSTWGLRDAQGINFAVASDEIAAFLQSDTGILPGTATTAPAVELLRAELVRASFEHRQTEAGRTITLSYVISNASSTAGDIVLGASIRTGSGSWLSDPDNDRRVSVPAGTSTQTRPFRIPSNASPGTYELWLSVLSTDKTASLAKLSVPGLTVDASDMAPPEPKPLPSPVDAVSAHYRAIAGRDFRTAWSHFSPRYQSGLSYEQWAAGYAQTRSVDLQNVTVVNQSATAATVQIALVSVDTQGTGTVRKRFEGSWSLILVGGAWKLDRPTIRQVE